MEPPPTPRPPPPPRGKAQPHHQRYGADLTPRQFAMIQLALFVGSSIEWFDFSVFGALAPVITPLFFPAAAGESTQALYFWGVFCVAFLARPLGALLLGSVGDRWGRRPALLISLAGMAVPTVLIGCLPTYGAIGVAAPALLALLRAVQGLAMGAEFSGALVYSVELAPRDKKGKFSAVTLQAAMAGIALGNAAVMVLTAALTAQQMRAWGWRLPFLVTALSGLGAFALRMHMPEPRAWEDACEPSLEEAGEERSGGGGKGAGLPRASSDDGAAAAAAAARDEEAAGAEAGAAAAAAAAAERGGGGGSTDSPALATTAPAKAPGCCCPGLRSRPNLHPRTRRPHPRRRHTRGVPALKVLRQSWPQVLLQAALEAFESVGFYVVALWLPTRHQSSGLMSAEAAGGATLAALAAMSAATALGGWASDACATPRRRLLAASAAVAVGTAVVVPGFLAVSASSAASSSAAPVGSSVPAGAGAPAHAQAAAALFQAAMLALVGFALAVVPSLCAELYRPDVRVVSFSLGHNLAMSLLGGTAPLVISAMAATAAGRRGAAPGVYIAAAGAASLLAAAALAAWAPRLFVAAGEGARGGEEEEEEEAVERPPPPVAEAYV